MECRELGRSGLKVSVFGLGCWAMGGDEWGGTDDAVSIRTIHRALDVGINYLDTAEAYGKGHSEAVVGQALVGKRDKAIVSTKAARGNLAPAAIKEALDASLRRLQTDYVDLYFMHWPNADVPISDSMGTFMDLKREGKIKAIGVSNFSVAQIQEAQRYGQVDAVQPPYNLFWRHNEKDVIPFCKANEIGITTYSSLAQGLLAGAITKDTVFNEGDNRPRTVPFQPHILPLALEAVEKYRAIAARHNVTLAQLCLRWVIDQPGVTTSLVGARAPGEVDDNLGAFGWELSPETAAEMKAISVPVAAETAKYENMFVTLFTQKPPEKS